MKKVAFFDTKQYDMEWFEKLNKSFEIEYYEEKLNPHTAIPTKNFTSLFI